MRTGDGTGAGGGDIDPADLWVRDSATGEFRMRRPGERPPPTAPVAPPGAPVVGPAPAAGRASRRRQPGARTGLWVGGALCFLLAVGGVSAFVLVKGGSGTTADNTAATVARPSCTPASSTAPKPQPSAVVEPPVSGSFLNGPVADPIDIRVTVLDGSGTFGQAEAVLEWMQNSKDYLRSSNGGPASVAPRTTLVYAPDHVSQARALAAAMGLPASALHGDGNTSDTIGRMVLTLGQDFHGIGKPFTLPAAAVPSAQASSPGAGTADGANGCGSQ
ncbi:LytR C-terminal domain-containing protein [Streptacidiphilus sp. P02-A3a]|uniref:LytR C-terminal domain-containing protein n=1 Tax=Streptacidiphilus sp. P02-A3a TaxID=2704468 RepID=UPI0015FCA39E|nr:LytR C-terminal domain-containing protein [Streptacidiphilus sp. P02-A3a]QMU67849.1 LytR C-terminal domain-containing protein [Streptacidiphilus sp. P02-A3a]